jgi:hypothetical protein
MRSNVAAGQSDARRASRDFLVFATALREKQGVAVAGALWMPWQRRGDFQRLWRELRAAHGGPRRARWKKVGRRHQAFFVAAVDAFFDTPWLRFRAVVDLAASAGDGGEAALGGLLEHAMVRLERGARHRVRVAARAADAAAVPVPLGAAGTLRVVAEDEAPALQLARLLCAAVRAAHAGRVRGAARRAIAARLAARSGVAELALAGAPADGRFQIWLPVELAASARA